MVVGPPPTFEFMVPTEGLPPSVRDLDGFQKLLADFYAKENINKLWQQVKPFYDSLVTGGPYSITATAAAALEAAQTISAMMISSMLTGVARIPSKVFW